MVLPVSGFLERAGKEQCTASPTVVLAFRYEGKWLGALTPTAEGDRAAFWQNAWTQFQSGRLTGIHI